MSQFVVKTSTTRSSNIELLRIIAMLLIVAHHYVVNSTVMGLFDGAHPTANSLFCSVWGMWGKTAINVFVLISGYFMCIGTLTLRRYLKISLQVGFYAWVMWIILCCCGYETWCSVATLKRLTLYGTFANPNGGFVSAFLWMYLTIPVMNLLLKHISKSQLYLFLLVLITMFSVVGTFCMTNVYHHVFWYMTLYLLGSAIRQHPFQWMERNKICLPLLLLSLIGALASVFVINGAAYWLNHPSWMKLSYHFVADSHKILALAVSLFAFLTFKNWQLGYSKFINGVASTCFGVLLIHAAFNGMRRWLWQDFVDVPRAHTFPFWTLVGYSIVVAVGVFVTCSALDWLRIRYIEKYYLDFGEKVCKGIWKRVYAPNLKLRAQNSEPRTPNQKPRT